MSVLAAAVASIAATVAMRYLPARLTGISGVDAWYHLLTARELRRQRRLPIRVDSFAFEDPPQAYPPLFAILLAVLPDGFRMRTRAWIQPAIEAVHVGLLVWAGSRLGLSPLALLLAGVVYAVTPTLVDELALPNPRGLTSLLVTVWVLAVSPLAGGPAWPWSLLAATGVGALVLLTNKMGAQFLGLLAMVLAASSGSAWAVATLPASAALAWLASGGFYGSVLRSHWNILRYWRRHVADLNAHQVYDSALFEAPPGWRSPRYFRGGLRGQARATVLLVAQCPWILLAPVALPHAWDTPQSQVLVAWVAAAWLAAAATTLVPGLRFLGEGHRYLKFGVFPLALLVVGRLGRWPDLLAVGAVLGLVFLFLRRVLRGRRWEVIDADLDRVLGFLRDAPGDGVATLPTHPAAPIAYLTPQRVLWGGQSSGYERLAAWAPVIREPIPTLLARYSIAYLLVDTRYVDPARLDLGDVPVVFRSGHYVVFEMPDDGFAGERAPDPLERSTDPPP